MNIRDLQYLVALYEHKHFRKAAEACFVSQPTLSGQIKKLEETLGVELIQRNSRKVSFSDDAIKMITQAQLILKEIDNLKVMAKSTTSNIA